MNSNCGIIKGIEIDTSNGVYRCTDLWMGIGGVVAFDFKKLGDNNIITISRNIIADKITTGSIKVL